MSITSWFYKMARLSNDISALSSLNPSRMLRRGTNKLIGRHVASRIYFRSRRRRFKPRG